MATRNENGIAYLQKQMNKPVPKSTEQPKQPPASDEHKQQGPEPIKKKLEYMRLDVTDYKEYVSLMAEHMTNVTGKYVSMTQYILRLIEADKQQNLELFKKLEAIQRMKREIM